MNIEVEKLAYHYSKGWGENDDAKSFAAGFRAAMDLQLPVLFHDWMISVEGQEFKETIRKKYNENLSTEVLYAHFIENIFPQSSI